MPNPEENEFFAFGPELIMENRGFVRFERKCNSKKPSNQSQLTKTHLRKRAAKLAKEEQVYTLITSYMLTFFVIEMGRKKKKSITQLLRKHTAKSRIIYVEMSFELSEL